VHSDQQSQATFNSAGATTQCEESSHAATAVEQAAEFIREDLQRRALLGESVRIDDYPSQLIVVRSDPVEFIALILDEFSIRSESGEQLDVRKFAARFPDLSETLAAELSEFSDSSIDCKTEAAASDDDSASQTDADTIADFNAAPQQLSDFREGSVCGDFRIEGVLGTGGLSQVFLATQLSLDRRVALKVTPLEDTSEHGSFEGRTMAALVHGNIVPVFAEQTLGQFHLLAMACISGPTLADFLSELNDRAAPESHSGRRLQRARTTASDCRRMIRELADSSTQDQLEADETRAEPATRENQPQDSGRLVEFSCRTVREIALALTHANRQNVFHCDVKPANILFTADARPMLTDFNVSVRSGCESGSQLINRPVGGTLLYMAPEHLGMLTGTCPAPDVDGRADVYSLGLILFELLTGAWPFPEEATGEDPLTAAGHLQGIRISAEIEFPSESRLSPALRSIVSTCLAARPGDRYQSASDLAEDLDRYLSLKPLLHAPDPSSLETLTRSVRRHRKPIAVSCVTSVLILLAAGIFQMTADGEASSPEQGGTQLAADAFENATLGRRHVERGQFELAIPCLERAVEQNPQLVPAWNNLGIARYRLGQFAGAREAFSEVIRLGTETGTSYSHRAAARFALGDNEGAAVDFSLALELATPSDRSQVLQNIREFEARRQDEQAVEK
jgi:serine/threonine protein kinase